MRVARASAPGKLFLSGEYAVLEGAPAVVTAVDRRALAETIPAVSPESPVLEAVGAEVFRRLEAEGAATSPWPGLRADSEAFSAGGAKLGLGSSAAVAAAASGALFEWAGRPIADHLPVLLELATAAHRAAQGGRGSGADVAAAVHGGTILFSTGQPVEPIRIDPGPLAFVWTGRAASTVELLGRVAEHARRDPTTHRACLDELSAVARELARAHREADGPAIVAGTARHTDALARLGQATGAPLVTEEHRRIDEIARSHGGAAKPSGAGGGDLAVAAFADSGARSEFVSGCREAGFQPIPIAPGAPGLTTEPGL